MREKQDRKKRSQQTKAFKEALQRPPSDDSILVEEQRLFCLKVIQEMLSEESSYSFSKPVTELWDISELPGYFEKVPTPMDLGTIKDNIQKNNYIHATTNLFDFHQVVDNVHLVFQNCLAYIDSSSDLAKLSKKLMAKFDKKISEMPLGVASDDVAESAPDNNEQGGTSDRMETSGDSDIDSVMKELTALKKQKGKCEGNLAEMALEKNMPMTAEERMKLRDEVENAEWEKVEQVGRILRKHVDKAVGELPSEEDPEYVILELNDVEPALLREVEQVIIPNLKKAEEEQKLDKLNTEIEELQAKLTELKNSKRRR